MHELPLTNKVLEIALNHAFLNNGSCVKEIILGIGELSDIEEYWMNHYFSYISVGTIAENASLKIHKIGVEWECDTCGKRFFPDSCEDFQPVCINCGEKKNLSLIKGREFLVEAITII